MRWLIALLLAVFTAVPQISAAPARQDFASAESVLHWINRYRLKPDTNSMPAAVRALSRYGSFKDPEAAGVYVGFIAGVLGSNPDRADELVEKIFPLPSEDHWIVVRAIAYSGLPEWKELLRRFAPQMPSRNVMIEKYLDGRLPTLAEVAPARGPSLFERLRSHVIYERERAGAPKPMTWALEASPELLDTLWGYYFATGTYGPVLRIVALLPWSTDRDHVERLMLGSMAKYTLASNATRDVELLSMLKSAKRHAEKDTAKLLTEVIDAAETAQTGRIRKEALAAIEELKRQGPGSKREVAWWGKVGEGAIGIGCVAAAVTGHVELGIPCVVGGAVSSAALRFWAGQ